ncbi:hypothetical protein ACFL2U_00410 [Patescibacteria group bacterium]
MNEFFKRIWYPKIIIFGLGMIGLIFLAGYLDQRLFPWWSISLSLALIVLYFSHCYDKYKEELSEIKNEKIRQVNIARVEEEIKERRQDMAKNKEHWEQKKEDHRVFMLDPTFEIDTSIEGKTTH